MNHSNRMTKYVAASVFAAIWACTSQAADLQPAAHVFGVAINVADLNRSVEFYNDLDSKKHFATHMKSRCLQRAICRGEQRSC